MLVALVLVGAIVAIVVGATSPSSKPPGSIAVAGANTPATPHGYQTYVDQRDRFSIAVPAIWREVNPSSPGAAAFFQQMEQANPKIRATLPGNLAGLAAQGTKFFAIDATSQSGGARTTVVVEPALGSSDGDLPQARDEVLTEYDKLGVTKVETSCPVLNGHDALAASADWPYCRQDGSSYVVHDTQYLLFANDFSYVINSVGPSPELPTVLSTFNVLTGGRSAVAPAAPNSLRATAPATTAPPATVAPTIPATQPAPAPKGLLGSGDAVTEPFAIQGGLTVFTCETSGSSKFVVQLVDGTGTTVATLVNAVGSFTGLTGLSLAAGGYTLKITAGGNWVVEVAQPRNQPAQALPWVYAGCGQTFLGPFHASSAVRLTADHDGQSKFVVQVLDSDGSLQDTAINQVGHYSGSTVDAGPDGDYYVNVVADGSWTINLMPISATPSG